jgi:hypothetical protein
VFVEPSPAVGDLVISAPPVEPVGVVERILPTSRGLQLLVQRAFAHDSYLVLPATGVAAVEDDLTFGLRWIVARGRVADLIAAGMFRRALGRLRPDPFPASRPGQPAVVDGVDDVGAARSIDLALAAHPLTGGSDLTVRVRYGVSVLEGWVPTVAGKVQADRLARTTPGIWEVRNRLMSDEEGRVLVRDALRARPHVAAAVADFRMALGRVVVELLPDAPVAVEEEVRQAVSAVTLVRQASVERRA